MQPPFENTLAAAVKLLRDLPRGRHDFDAAKARVDAFRATHPATDVQLVVDRPPGSPRVDYDLLLNNGEDGSVALSWRADHGVPWSVNYAEHWAANWVASVDHYSLEVQDALLFLSLWCQTAPNVIEELERQLLIGHALQASPVPVEEGEIQDAADRFRLQHRLLTGDQMAAWLEAHGISPRAFRKMMIAEVQSSKFKRDITDHRIEQYFIEHHKELGTVQYFLVNVPTETLAAALAAKACARGLLTAIQEEGPEERAGLEASLVSKYVCDVAEVLVSAAAGTVISPFLYGSHYVVIEVLARNPAQLDASTREFVRNRVLQDWISERQKQFPCSWHWM